MAKSSFFKKNSDYTEMIQGEGNNIEKKEEEKYEFKKIKDTTIMDREITKYVINNFPSMATEIRNALINLASTLENTIDFIEDKSSSVIKNDRDFKLSQEHRDKSIEIYDVVQKINDYVNWMNEEYDDDKIETKEQEINDIEEVTVEENLKEEVDNINGSDNLL
ncbi:hypothetical protein NNC19_19400 [Clostridium sp. SHJSY1]|uniref:hypothetical protein n=1 Tax=Clostridium sp. SHJSY1 TaxID=2942483 RepID=UPI0028768C26|nr:hypothetical protein [Clostridium sp. SHJSY1]MDS0527862.1 hypothetical protein [Clostridium sp. SHJSY1]